MQLGESKTDVQQTEGEASLYFGEPKAAKVEVHSGIDFEKLLELNATDDGAESPDAVKKKPQEQSHGNSKQRRGELRKQATKQLQKLQANEQNKPVQPREPALQKPRTSPEKKQEAVADSPQSTIDDGRWGHLSRDYQAAPDAPAVAAGTDRLSLHLNVTPVGTAYHFRKLHGEPRLVLRARHEDLSHGLSAVVWAGLCLALATATIQGLRRPNVPALANYGWPWLAAIIGAAWLFLLPAGVVGLALLVIALCLLITHMRKRRTTDPTTPNDE